MGQLGFPKAHFSKSKCLKDFLNEWNNCSAEGLAMAQPQAPFWRCLRRAVLGPSNCLGLGLPEYK